MLAGADFFLSHRMFVSSTQHKLYFTYNGGPVFKLADDHLAVQTTPSAMPVAVSAPAPALAASLYSNEPKDAPAFGSRRRLCGPAGVSEC